MIPQFPVYLFDVDGTLVHSAPDICAAVQETLQTTPAPKVDDAFLTTYIGRHLIDLFTYLLPHYSPQQIDDLVAVYRKIYPARQHKSTSLYPGVSEALSRLGGRKSTATTKGTPTTRIILEMFGLIGYFDHIQGTDGFPAKPAPDVILKSLDLFGVKPQDCLLVGDSATDMAAGRAAGVRLCAVRYGYGNHEEMAAFQPDYWVDDLNELVVSSTA